MVSSRRRTLTLYDDDQPESSSMAAARTTSRQETIFNFPLPSPPLLPHGDEDLNLTLALFYHPLSSPLEQPQPSPENAHQIYQFFGPQLQPEPLPVVVPAPRLRRRRRNTRKAPRHGKSLTIQPPFPWATNHRAVVHNLKHLVDGGMTTISGDVHCKRCDQRFQMEYNLRDKFLEVANYIIENKHRLHERAPRAWQNPSLPNCRFCGQENSVKPVIAQKRKSINWLFLLLGQMLGCCTLEQLRYFCKHTENHRTGAKDRVLFLTYLGLCKQLDPTGPFDPLL